MRRELPIVAWSGHDATVATLAELLAIKTRDQILEQLIALCNGAGLPVTDWEPGGVARTMLEVDAAGLKDLSDLVEKIARSCSPALASGDWLTLVASEYYGLTRIAATRTVQRCLVTCQAGFGSASLTNGTIVQSTSTGKRYVYNGADTGVIEGSPAYFDFDAEEPGTAYADIRNTLTVFATSAPGLTIDNPRPDFGGVDGSGNAIPSASNAGGGTVTPSKPSGTVYSRQYTIRVLTSGQVTAGSASVSYYDSDGILRTNTLTPIPASYTGTGDAYWDPAVELAFANGSSSPSFVVGDVFTFSTPGSQIVTGGADEETDDSLRARCFSRWAALSDIITDDKVKLWLFECSQTNQYGITKVTVRASGETAGLVEAFVATAAGAPGGTILSGLQAFVDARCGVGDEIQVTGATNVDIYATGTVYVRTTELAAVKAAAKAAWDAYLGALPIGGDRTTGLPGVVRAAALERILLDAGAIDKASIAIHGGSPNLELDRDEVAVKQYELDDASYGLTWVAVA